MSKITEVGKKIAEGMEQGYKGIERGVVEGYKAVETGVVGGYQAIEDGFVKTFLTKKSETVEEAKQRLSGQKAELQAQDAAPIEEEGSAEILNDYGNTEELSRMFPVVNPTAITTEMGRKIQNRLLTGFANWNRGFNAWKAWGDILYTKDSIYNVHGVRFTLEEYQQAMNVILKKTKIDMGQFRNMIICDNWTAIHYDIFTHVGDQVVPGSVMEFVDFKDFGLELGVRVNEGWGGPKDAGFQGMAMFQGENERVVMEKQFEDLIAYQIPETDDLKAKYPVLHPTTDDSPLAEAYRMAILKDFDAWNRGQETWAENADAFYAKDAFIVLPDGKKLTVEEYKTAMAEQSKSMKTTKKYFDSMLISGEWAAIHFRTVTEDLASGARIPGDVMQFFRFTQDGDSVRVTENWIK